MSDSFESGLASHWEIPDLGGEGRVAIRELASAGFLQTELAHQYSSPSNPNALVFDSSRASGDNDRDLAVAILTLDLSGAERALLTFHHLESLDGDTNHELPDQHSIDAVGDGLAISDDGVDWFKLRDFDGGTINRGGDGLWRFQEYELIAEINRLNQERSAGLNIEQPIRIKFSQYDNESYPHDGWVIDDINVVTQTRTFDPTTPRGAFQRFDVSGESPEDITYRVGLFGDVNADTPILVSVHGISRGTSNDTTEWQRFIQSRVEETGDLIVVAPLFYGSGKYGGYQNLAWIGGNDAATALTKIVDDLSAKGIGDSHDLRLYGFSGGGQFVGRFPYAYPQRVSAVVSAAGATFTFPDDRHLFRWGIAETPFGSIPPQAAADIDLYLQNRIMAWVGQLDTAPDADRDPRSDMQGINHVTRALNFYESIHSATELRGLSSDEFEFELLVQPDVGHSRSRDNYDDVYEFLFREPSNGGVDTIVARVVATPNESTARATLPDHIDRLRLGEDYFVEVYVRSGNESPIRRAAASLAFDTDAADILSIEQGAMSETTGEIDEDSGRVNELGGTFLSSNAGVGQYELLGRIKFRPHRIPHEQGQFTLALQRTDQRPQHADGSETRTDLLPIPATWLGDFSDGEVRGNVYEDADQDGRRQSSDPGNAGWLVELHDEAGPLMIEGSVEPDSFPNNAFLNRVSPYAVVSAVGDAVIGPTVAVASHSSATTGSNVFEYFTPTGTGTRWNDQSLNLRIDFPSPAQSVRIDAIAKTGASRDRGRLQVFDASGNLLDQFITQDLRGNGAVRFETMRIDRANADIAFAIASADTGEEVRLDNLAFSVPASAATDEQGNYQIRDLAAGEYVARLRPREDAVPTSSEAVSVTVASGVRTNNVDFGIRGVVPGITVEPLQSNETSESGSRQPIHIRLSSRPFDDVVIVANVDDATEAAVSPDQLTFGFQSWDQPQTLTVQGLDDEIVDGAQDFEISIEVVDTLSSPTYSTLSPKVIAFTNADDDVAALQVSPSTTRLVDEQGIADHVDVSLSAQPTSPVTINVTPNDPAMIAVNRDQLVFDPSTWRFPQRVNIRAVDNARIDGLRQASVQLAADPAASDAAFAGATFDVPVSVRDDDVARIVLSNAGDGISLPESDGNHEVRVRLSAQPSDSISIRVVSGEPAALSAAPSFLQFSPENWNQDQTVTLRAIDNVIDQVDTSTTVALSIDEFGSDPDFAFAPTELLDITVVDDDQAGIEIDVLADTELPEGSDLQIPIRLTSQPIGDVLVTASTAPSEGMVLSELNLQFDNTTWDQFQLLTLRALDDGLIEGDQAVDLVIQVTDSADPTYSAIDGVQRQILVIDDDRAEIVIRQSEGDTIVNENGATDSVEIGLAARPTSPVTIHLQSDERLSTDPTSVTFLPSDWPDSKTVQIHPVDDELFNSDESATVELNVDPSVGDANYAALDPTSLSVRIIDNEIGQLRWVFDETSMSEENGELAAHIARSGDFGAQTLHINVGTEDSLLAPETVLLAAGSEQSETIIIRAIDNIVLDGDRQILLTVSADSFQSDEVEVIISDAESWRNPFLHEDVNRDNQVTASDALAIINELARRRFSDPLTAKLNSRTASPDLLFDTNNDGHATALDALRVINEMARIRLSGEDVSIFAVTTRQSPVNISEGLVLLLASNQSQLV